VERAIDWKIGKPFFDDRSRKYTFSKLCTCVANFSALPIAKNSALLFAGYTWHRLGPAERTKIINRPADFNQLPFTAFSYHTALERK
jgi:hypothetical protein